MKWLLSFLFKRLRERSTIVTVLTAIFGAIGFNLAPEAKEGIIVGVLAVLTAVGFLTPEKEGD